MISLLIPVYNEQLLLPPFFQQLNVLPQKIEIIFIDGGSSDLSVQLIKQQGFKLVHSSQGRSIQMNEGARQASGDFLFFLHADVRIPPNFYRLLIDLEKNKTPLANFQLAFDYSHWFLKWNATFSYSNWTVFQFGDQGLWVESALFKGVGGFNESMDLIEDQDLVKRLKKKVKLKKVKAQLTVSSRKYLKYGIFKLQFVYLYLYFLYRFGASQEALKKEMERWLKGS